MRTSTVLKESWRPNEDIRANKELCTHVMLSIPKPSSRLEHINESEFYSAHTLHLGAVRHLLYPE
jgi:hypothetical protein